jgi:hypothetical protein
MFMIKCIKCQLEKDYENLQPLCSKVNRYIKRDNYKFDCVATIISSGSTSSITTFPRSSS